MCKTTFGPDRHTSPGHGRRDLPRQEGQLHSIDTHNEKKGGMVDATSNQSTANNEVNTRHPFVLTQRPNPPMGGRGEGWAPEGMFGKRTKDQTPKRKGGHMTRINLDAS